VLRVPVLSDPVQLEMAVLKLAINARDAMPDGGELTIRTTRRHVEQDLELPAGDYVELAISDTGTGMPPEVAARAFDPFFTPKGMGKGTGLGLSQVYGIARPPGRRCGADREPAGHRNDGTRPAPDEARSGGPR
jgi:signal transduction histidine kinase